MVRRLQETPISGTPVNRNDFGPSLKFVEIVCPLLHHLPPLREVCRPVIGASVGISHGVGQLVLDKIRSNAENFVKNRSCYRTKSVPAHFLFCDAHAPHCSQRWHCRS